MATKGRGTPKTRQHRDTPRFRRAVAALALRVRTYRTARGWTVERTAEAMGVEPAHVRRLESGTANPSLAVLLSVAHAFGVTPAELLSTAPAK